MATKLLSKSKPLKPHKTPFSVKPAPIIPLPEESSSSESDNEDDSENSSDIEVDEAGMKRLIEALGEDGLDEFDQAQLIALEGGKSGESEDEDQSASGENENEDDGASENDELEGEELVALDEVDSVDEDAVPRQKIEIDNKVALERIRDTIQLDPSLPWTETLSVTYPHTISADVDDDLARELAFYKQALHGANTARSLASKLNFPFTRPSDYFAEMVKTDSHMERIRQRLLDEDASMKKSEDKRRERDGKKFGKQVQVEKLKEREKSKKDMDERLKGLKRKRKGALDNVQADDDAFDIAVEDAISDRPTKRGRGGSSRGAPSRTSRDQKYGFGGAGRRSKQNTRDSTDDFASGGGGRGGRGGARGGRGGGRGGASRGGSSGRGAKRLGKDKRMAGRGKR